MPRVCIKVPEIRMDGRKDLSLFENDHSNIKKLAKSKISQTKKQKYTLDIMRRNFQQIQAITSISNAMVSRNFLMQYSKKINWLVINV